LNAPVFIIGTGRCGTELLWKLLDAHPALSVLNESMFLYPALRRFGTRLLPSHRLTQFIRSIRHIDGTPTITASMRHAGISEADEEALLDKIACWPKRLSAFDAFDMIATAVAQIRGRPRWGEKTPDAGYFVKELATRWPHATFIHIIRNGLDTASSMMNHAGFRANVVSGLDTWVDIANVSRKEALISEDRALDRSEFLDLWGRRLLYIENQLSCIPSRQVLRISYEQLVNAPAQELRRICAWLGIDSPAAWLASGAERIVPGRISNYPADETTASVFARAPDAKEATAYVMGLSSLPVQGCELLVKSDEDPLELKLHEPEIAHSSIIGILQGEFLATRRILQSNQAEIASLLDTLAAERAAHDQRIDSVIADQRAARIALEETQDALAKARATVNSLSAALESSRAAEASTIARLDDKVLNLAAAELRAEKLADQLESYRLAEKALNEQLKVTDSQRLAAEGWIKELLRALNIEKDTISSLLRSRSWRYTQPARTIFNMMRALKKEK
jgi:hypothetical protein